MVYMLLQAYDAGANQTTYILARCRGISCASRRHIYGVVAYSHVERNLAVGEVDSAPYKIEMDLPIFFFKEAGQGQLNQYWSWSSNYINLHR
jgi:hypothetical protein